MPAYEFVTMLCWYLFGVYCSVLSWTLPRTSAKYSAKGCAVLERIYAKRNVARWATVAWRRSACAGSRAARWLVQCAVAYGFRALRQSIEQIVCLNDDVYNTYVSRFGSMCTIPSEKK